MKTPEFFVCKHCGNVVEVLYNSSVPVVCCGEPLMRLEANGSDGVVEKHVPTYKIEGNTVQVQVGEVIHPMLEEHYIGWVWLVTAGGGQRKTLNPGQEPTAVFALNAQEKPVAVYAWCNIHGLWKADIK